MQGPDPKWRALGSHALDGVFVVWFVAPAWLFISGKPVPAVEFPAQQA